MSDSEFDIIKKYFIEVGESPEWLLMGIGDDAAIIDTSAVSELLISIDTLNQGIHFPVQTSAFDIAYKALAVNLSDIAAMGGKPMWFTLSLSLPDIDSKWLKEFSLGLCELANCYALKLVGGDTSRGPLGVTIQIAGDAPAQQALTRSGAEVGDAVYVTGTLGDAAAGLALLQQDSRAFCSDELFLINRLNRPTPRIEVGVALRGVANACIDISDGLAGDLGHILSANQLGAEIDKTAIPISESLQEYTSDSTTQMNLALTCGDDYELCFSAPVNQAEAIKNISLKTDCRITRIGTITKGGGLFLRDDNGIKKIARTGFEHFTS